MKLAPEQSRCLDRLCAYLVVEDQANQFFSIIAQNVTQYLGSTIWWVSSLRFLQDQHWRRCFFSAWKTDRVNSWAVNSHRSASKYSKIYFHCCFIF